ncbi:glycoside hydrolase [Dipodascopsis tothii]|uniref:glycoside hydrolase n=1 Tax=Dipodascopsis tothii TaxID=44089 RepID=UPI0034CF5456
MDADTVKEKIQGLSGFSMIRLYGVDCSQVENVFAAITDSQKLFLGIYDIDQTESALDTIASAAATYGWDRIDTIAVGNELVNSGTKSVDEVVTAIATARSYLASTSYAGSIVTVDTFVAVMEHPELCENSDYAAVNCHPFFDGGVFAYGAGPFVAAQIGFVAASCSGKNVFVTETGWPHSGNSNGDATPSTDNQKIALDSLVSVVADDIMLFTAYDDLWKADGEYDVEKYWGIY